MLATVSLDEGAATVLVIWCSCQANFQTVPFILGTEISPIARQVDIPTHQVDVDCQVLLHQNYIFSVPNTWIASLAVRRE